MVRLAPALVAVAFSTVSCITDSSVLDTNTTLMMISADPTSFVGSSMCGTALRRYVVTLTDVTAGIVLQSSPPTPCTQQTSFTIPIIVEQHFYIGFIDGYDTDDVTPLGPGTREMVAADGTPVAPRWQSQCGQNLSLEAGAEGGDSSAPINPLLLPVQARLSAEVFLLGCRPFTVPLSDGGTSQPDGGTDASDDASQDGAENGSISSD
jgi:hypothetical protein